MVRLALQPCQISPARPRESGDPEPQTLQSAIVAALGPRFRGDERSVWVSAMTTKAATLTPQQYLQAQSRWHALEIAFWLATLLPFVLFPDYLSLASQIAITALFALSLDLILGYAGIVSLGHAAFFGIGAYTAGLFSKFIWGEPLTGLILATAVAGLVGFAVSFIVSRFRHFTLIMITLGLGLLAFETANRAHWLTGGSDGLQGVSIWPVLGIFKFDLYGYTAYAYSLATYSSSCSSARGVW